MKCKIRFLPVLLFIILIFLSQLVTSASQNQIIIDNCDGFDNVSSINSTKIMLDDFYKKEGVGSLKVSDSGAFIIAQFIFEAPLNIIKNLDVNNLYLEYWIYVTDETVLNGKPSQIEVSSSEEVDMDEYAWELSKYKYIKGWNRISLKFTDASKLGNPDLSKSIRIRFYSVVKAKAIIYLDEIIATDSPIKISDSQLGTVSITNSTSDTIYKYSDIHKVKLNKANEVYQSYLLYTILAAVLLCASIVYLTFILLYIRKKGVKKLSINFNTRKTKGDN